MADIKLENLTKTFDEKTVIRSLNLKVESGELIALLGPSGCGKTTTLKLLAGLIEPDCGDIYFAGKSILNLPTEKRGAVLVFQDYLLFPHMNIAENISFGLKMRGESVEYRRQRVDELLDMINLKGYAENYPQELSGGQQQRVALARALAINPKVLLLDEPISNLDSNLREEMRELIKKLHKKEKMTTIFVTHDREEALLVADKIAVMNEGKIEQFGSPEELYNCPNTEFVAEFFGETNYLKGKLKDGEFHCQYTNFPVKNELLPDKLRMKSNKEIRALIRPEYFNPVKRDKTAGKDCIQFEGKILKRKFAGERIYYQIDIDGKKLKITTLPHRVFETGETIKLEVSLNNVCFLE